MLLLLLNGFKELEEDVLKFLLFLNFEVLLVCKVLFEFFNIIFLFNLFWIGFLLFFN